MPPRQEVIVESYPFIPPTTFSGFLARVYLLSRWLRHNDKSCLDELRKHLKEKYKQGPLLLSKYVPCVVLGAFGDIHCIGSCLTRRQGHKPEIRLRDRKEEDEFKFTRFKRNLTGGTQYWPLLWRWYASESLTGYVLFEDKNEFKKLLLTKGYGFKIGYEGFAFVRELDEPRQLRQVWGRYKPSVPVVLQVNDRPALIEGQYYTLYKYEKFNEKLGPSFEHISAVWTDEFLEGNFYVNLDAQIYIPVSTVNFLSTS
ncbi:MAG: hypothetical protein QXP55_04395 [Nitrososphaerales archaeon]